MLKHSTCIRKKISFLCITVILLITAMAGCNSASENLTFPQFSPDEKSFSFPGTAWGMTLAETEKGLGYSLEELNDTSYYEGDPCTFYDLPASSTFQFQNDHLWAVGLSAPVKENAAKKFEEILAAAQETFGEETECMLDEEMKNPFAKDTDAASKESYHFYSWLREDPELGSTKVMLRALMTEGEIHHILLDVTKFPNDY